MGHLTTHVLDLAHGKPGAGVRVRLYRESGDAYGLVKETSTSVNGRCDQPLLADTAFTTGRYRLVFSAGAYFSSLGVELPDPPFVDEITIDFGVSDATMHYHVPLLVSPYGYSTYRGS